MFYSHIDVFYNYGLKSYTYARRLEHLKHTTKSRAETSSRRLSLVLPHVLVTQTHGHIYRLTE